MNLENIITTKIPYDGSMMGMEMEQNIIHSLCRLKDDWGAARRSLEEHWKECWAMYFGTTEAEQYLRSRVLETVGDAGKDWRHHINQSKAYDVVETAIPYFKSASFPNEDWFDIVPVVPIPGDDLAMGLKVLKEFVKVKLEEAQYKTVWEIFLRQLCILGTSVISLPWRLESRMTKKNVRVRGEWQDELVEMDVEKVIYNAPEMCTEDMFDVWLDPDHSDPNCAGLIRRFTMRRGEVTRAAATLVFGPRVIHADQ